MPSAVTLKGRFGHLEKLSASRVASGCWSAVKDRPELWTYVFYGPFPDEHAFFNFVSEIEQSEDPCYYAIFDRDGRACGWASLMRIQPAARVIEVGSIVYAPALQRTPLATEVQYLLARYVFEILGYRRYEWKCDALNARSRRAAERFGFTFEGIFKQHMIVKGRNRDTAWFAMLDSEWPRVKAAFERWLDPGNFGEDGHQRRSLEEIRNTL
ncbi:MAG TPA: GNAT family protein [Xanthobacteraceae bacterium]|nr:GNAT family protein [Xanthobacteraceae bacterium]